MKKHTVDRVNKECVGLTDRADVGFPEFSRSSCVGSMGLDEALSTPSISVKRIGAGVGGPREDCIGVLRQAGKPRARRCRLGVRRYNPHIVRLKGRPIHLARVES